MKGYFRVGESLGRTVYWHDKEDEPDVDIFLGIFDDPLIAKYVVEILNRTVTEDWSAKEVDNNKLLFYSKRKDT